MLKPLTRQTAILSLALAMTLAPAISARCDSPSGERSFMNETPAQRDARMKWFREARFGMFIHWGLYSQAAGNWDGKTTSGAGEWIMNDLKIPDSQYAKLVPQFNPVKFDAQQWVNLAKAAGVKYIVITSKHHEGFGMYPSALTDWCLKSTPFQRDPLKELAAACKGSGVKLCFYHSIMDWHHPDYLPRKSWNDLASSNPDFDHYITYMKGQLRELLTGYGPIGLVWFDGQWEDSWNYDRGVDLYNYVRSLQPDIIVNNRVGRDAPAGKPKVGDYGTPEQYIPTSGYGPDVDWETCMTMNDTWGFKESDHNWKSTETLIRNLVDIASKGGNYLLNVGPTWEGLIPEASVERLQAIGQWMRVNGAAIYATTASPFSRQLDWGRCTRKIEGSKTVLYLHVFNWPKDGALHVPGLQTKPRRAWLLADPRKNTLHTETSAYGLNITVPPTAPDPVSSTIVVEFTRPLEISPLYIGQQSDGSVILPASDARLHGDRIRYETDAGHDDLGYWFSPEDWADWQFKVRTPGKFQVVAAIAAPVAAAIEVSIDKQTLHSDTPVTGGYADFKTVDLGSFEIAAPGVITLAVHPVKNGWQPINLKSVELKPLPPTP